MSPEAPDRRNLIKGAIALFVYIGAIVAANILSAHFGLVPVGFGLVVTAGTYAAGFALLSRDFVHTYLGVRGVLLGIAVGVILSWFLATPALAMASAVAFLVAELADMLVFLWIRPRGFVRAALISNCVSAPVDTVLFLWIAGFPLMFESIVGQMVGKILWATIVPLGIYVAVRALLRVRRERHLLRDSLPIGSAVE
ncbi:VUT family protein [Microbacterium sp. CPCC 204701]|uniref:VUT family protein n=1 Tax=Microbacterium sp. CPCC 204701 TaxID=2493084 RepID=UPI000FD6C2C4|nr:VUT family protein [Microbacterium sp. CPCC 204701]